MMGWRTIRARPSQKTPPLLPGRGCWGGVGLGGESSAFCADEAILGGAQIVGHASGRLFLERLQLADDGRKALGLGFGHLIVSRSLLPAADHPASRGGGRPGAARAMHPRRAARGSRGGSSSSPCRPGARASRLAGACSTPGFPGWSGGWGGSCDANQLADEHRGVAGGVGVDGVAHRLNRHASLGGGNLDGGQQGDAGEFGGLGVGHLLVSFNNATIAPRHHGVNAKSASWAIIFGGSDE